LRHLVLPFQAAISGYQMRHSSGFTLALAGFALLTCGDAIIKSMAGLWPATAIAALRFSIAVPLLASFVLASQGKAALRVGKPLIQLGRGISIAASSCLFFFSLFLLPLAEATAIVFASPIITALLSALFLREHMRPIAWVATFLALAGVAMVLRPNLAELGIVAFLPLVAAFFFAMMMILNRLAAGSGSPMALQWALATVAAPILLIVAFAGNISGAEQLNVGWPHWSVVLRCAIVAVTASTAHWLIYLGTTQGNRGRRCAGGVYPAAGRPFDRCLAVQAFPGCACAGWLTADHLRGLDYVAKSTADVRSC
jgi:drug/metabolite transporter (DMT)-like permease